MGDTNSFTCKDCGEAFTVPAASLAKYPGWVPKQCMRCRSGKTAPAADTADALARFSKGPSTGIFTDGGSEPNPGRGGWGAVKVVDNEIVEERHGREERTTNNRMELRALIEAYRMLGEDEEMPVYSDSQYCVKLVNEWAAGWEKRGWKRKTGPIENLDLVQELYALAEAHPKATLTWIRGHAGSRWNEYADALTRAEVAE